jgi:hypothetical protein
MFRLKKHIALFLSSLAMLALLLHGIVPHHHHDFETDFCQLEATQSTDCACDHSVESVHHGDQFCQTSHSESHSHPHICNFNSEKIKNVPICLVAVVKVVATPFINNNKQVHLTKYFEYFTASPPPESNLLRAPPLG